MGLRQWSIRARGAAAGWLLVLLTSLRAVGSPATANAGESDENATSKRIEIIHEGDRSASPADWNQWRVTKGTYRLAMTYQDFYRLTGRPDLAEQDSSRRTRSTVSIAVGAAGFLAGIIIAPWRYLKDDSKGALIGLALVGGGYATLKLGEHLSRPSISEAEAVDLARSYNSTLGQSADGPISSIFGSWMHGYRLSMVIGSAGTKSTGMMVSGSFQ